MSYVVPLQQDGSERCVKITYIQNGLYFGSGNHQQDCSPTQDWHCFFFHGTKRIKTQVILPWGCFAAGLLLANTVYFDLVFLEDQENIKNYLYCWQRLIPSKPASLSGDCRMTSMGKCSNSSVKPAVSCGILRIFSPQNLGQLQMVR